MNTNLSIDISSSVPAYMQLYSKLRDGIINGVFPYDRKLPSKRLLSAETGVSVITVEHAYAILIDEGYIVARERSGYFVAYSAGDRFQSAKAAPLKKRQAQAKAYEDGAFPFSVFAKTMRKTLLNYGESILEKSQNNGCAVLREAIAEYLARSRGMRVDCEQIVVGSGAEYLYGLIVLLLGKRGVFALESPSYEKIERVYMANGVECELLKLGADGIKTSELERSKADVLHVTPYYSFPSSVTASASKRTEYMAWAKARGGHIVEDDYYSEFTVSRKIEDTLFSLEPENTVIYINTFSKTIAPSIRVGYMVLPKNMVGAFREKLGFFSCTVPVFEQYVLAELINNGDFERHINRIRRKRRKTLD